MLRDLRQLCDRHSELDPDDLRATASALLEQQFLLLERRKDRDAYRLAANHFEYFTNLLDAFGWTLYRDDDFGIIGILPAETEAFARLKLVDSLLILCLRLLFEEGLEKFEVHDKRVYTDTEELLGRYEILLGRPRPLWTEFKSILARLRRYSLIETDELDNNERTRISILPTIRLVTGEQVQQRLLALAQESTPGNSDTDNADVSDQ